MPRTTAPAAPPTTAPEPESASDLAPLTVAQIHQQTDSGSFSRGRGYARGGRIFRPFRRGNTLHARCHGSTGGPYRVEATLATLDQDPDENPISVACDCPRGGFCKHIVAMLLTWIEDPASFVIHPPVAELLAGKSREELVALIELILHDNPDLDLVLRLPPPVAGALSDAPVDEGAIRRQIAAALQDDGYSYDRNPYHFDEYAEIYPGSGVLTEALARLTSLGEAYASAGQWRNALSVYATFVEQVAPEMGVVQEYREYQEYEFDGESEIDSLLVACDRGLVAILDAQATLPEAERLSADERDRLIEALYTVWFNDIEVGGLDLAQEGPEAIGRAATAGERLKIGTWLRQLIVPATGAHSQVSWMNRSAIEFLSLLGPDGGMSDDELLAEFRKAELWEDAAAMLLRTRRVEEAIALAARRLTAAPALTHFANQLIATGDPLQIEQAITLVDDCLWEREGRSIHDDHVLSAWLEHQFAAHGRPAEALKLARRRFQQAPSRQTYEAVMAAALLPDQTGEPWTELRPTLLATLQERNDWLALVDIHMAAAELPEAIVAFKQTRTRGSQAYIGLDYAERIAVAVAPTLPDEAIQIYRDLANRMIEHRKRDYYRQAAYYLAEVKHLLLTSDRTVEWAAVITLLRQQHKTLRALQDELNALNL